MVASLHVEPSLIIRIKAAQDGDGELWSFVQNIDPEKQPGFHFDDHGILWMYNHLCVPANKELREELMEEAHRSPFSIHPDRLTKYAHFLAIRENMNLESLTLLYRNEIVRLHGIPVSIVSNRDPKFTSRFWKEFEKAWGTKLNYSTAFHPQSDGQSERTIQTLEDMLRASALEWYGNWDDYLSLVEFAYNNSWQSSIGMAPFEALYGRKCRTPICWNEVGEKLSGGPDLVQVTTDKVAVARERLEQARSTQKSYADKGRREYEFKAGDKVGVVAYRVALPPQLSRVHNVFHASILRKYVYHPNHVVQYPLDAFREDLSCEEEAEAILAREERVLRKNTIPFVKVLWENHDVREATWETEDSVRARYPYLFESDETHGVFAVFGAVHFVLLGDNGRRTICTVL
ncbi:uncharacterized protein LOC141703459 [Apium graveolens]|uniref:uncharacterized protein LOC141703459 n=1 Tax=Apium graveolens TaxID=4045 RepID=UPI003D7A7A86